MNKVFLFLIVVCVFAVSAQATPSSFYAQPRLGGQVALDQANTEFSVGVAAGYRWFKIFAIELAYDRIFSDPANNLLALNGTVTAYNPLVTPYGIVGAGIAFLSQSGADALPMFRIGGGAQLSLIPFVKPFVQLTYLNVDGDNDFLEPMAGVSFGF